MSEFEPSITLQEIRAKHKLTQAQFAKTIGVSAQAVSVWEKNIFSISPKNLLKICRTYKVSSIDLLGA